MATRKPTQRPFALHRNAAARLEADAAARSGPVTVRRVRPDVWRAAVKLAGGDPARLIIISPATIVVVNQPRGGAS